jgi:polysaccharide pyruvyl transferase WcaK-like protein
VWDNYIKLIQYILSETDHDVMLIPHVVKPDTDDRSVLRKIKSMYEDNARVILIEDCNCMELKGYISQCSLFVGARTHAVIAAYSSCVPTLAVGYSIKAKGIAKDIFGSYEQYVTSVEDMKDPMTLTNAYKRISESSADIEIYLKEKMPVYKQKAAAAAGELMQLGL